MFHFKRQTLWIIIYVTIPLIFILNSVGPGPEQGASSDIDAKLNWSLESITLECDKAICHQSLDGTTRLWVSAMFKPLPVSQVTVPDGLEFTVSRQGGYVVATLAFEQGPDAWRDVSAFLIQWLPANASIMWLVSGADPASFDELLANMETQMSGLSLDNEFVRPKAELVWQAPVIGDPDQLAFLLWIEVLKQRLAGSGIEVAWDHRQSNSYVTLNQPVPAGAFLPVNSNELEPILAVYVDSANERLRSGLQHHRYGVTSIIYSVPYSLFSNQPQRLAQITLDSVNKMREFSFEQSK